jgi:endonuclease/exonuclease/phosphatase family metal-dependent hydrolase
MTFNIRYDNPDDGVYSWKNRKAQVIEVIKKYKPDVVGFQEALKNQVDDLQAGLEGYDHFGVGRDDGKEAGEYSVIFYNKARFFKEGGSTFWLSESPETPGSKSWNTGCTRVVTWIKVKDRTARREICFFNTHFDNASEEARIESARMLLTKTFRIPGKLPVIITGDFNDSLSSRMYNILCSPGNTGPLRDTRKSSPQGTKEPTYSYVGFPFDPANGELCDYIFTRNDNDLSVKSYKILTDSKGGKYPSDHLPILVEFSFTIKK